MNLALTLDNVKLQYESHAMFEIRWVLDLPSAPPFTFLNGYIDLSGNSGKASSRDTDRSRTMMLVLSMATLLDKISTLLTSIRVREYEFSNVEGWFHILFRKQRDNRIEVTCNNTLIHTGIISEIHDAIEKSVSNFCKEYDIEQVLGVAERSDLLDSYRRFRELNFLAS